MYLSRVAINRRLRKSQQALAFPQMLHAAVLDSFPPSLTNEKKTADSRILWRTDYFGENIWLYVLSENPPDFTHIIEQFGWPNSGQQWETKDYSVLMERIAIGQTWQFRLHANPVHTVDGKIYSHVTIDQQKQWLCDRALKNGFSFSQIEAAKDAYDSFEIVYRNHLRFKKHPRDNTWVTLSVATFQGHLVVEDVQKLRHALCFGIGRARAYGCGFLTLANPKL
jgi:CRISPR system Cascade subunit CasE